MKNKASPKICEKQGSESNRDDSIIDSWQIPKFNRFSHIEIRPNLFLIRCYYYEIGPSFHHFLWTVVRDMSILF